MNEKLDFHQLYQDHVKMVYNLCLNYLQITQLPTDNFKFKVPTLRNIEFSYPYMHDGRFNSLREVLDHYSSHNFPPENLSKKLVNGIMLSSNEKTDIIAFLLTLSDKEFLFNPDFQFPRE